jgi:5'-nucleotidase
MKKLTLLHSNDMHGDFFESESDGIMSGGISRLGGYVEKVRKEEKNTIFAIAGDMFRGSVIDSDYMGLSTIDLVNLLSPDVACPGNHEVDYGIAHLLFLEKCARFPIVCSNMFVTMNNTRLFTPYVNIEIDGMRILFIGILTKEVLASTKTEKIIGMLIDVEDAAREVGVICDNYRTTSTDMTILLTHIGIEDDRRLAQLLDPRWGVNMIIGGHSHTSMEQPEIINGIPIVQASYGTKQIGRFDILYDEQKREIHEWKWNCIPLNDETCEKDPAIEDVLNLYREESDFKYRRIVTRLARKLTHPSRTRETELGNLYADMMQDDSSFDIMLFGSGAIRKQELGPIVEYADMLENTPFDDVVHMLEVTGAQFRRMVLHILRDEAWQGHTEFYQFSKGVRIVYRKSTHELHEFKFNGEDITDDMHLKIAMQHYHFINFDEFFGVPLSEVIQNRHPRIVITSVNNIVEEYMTLHQGLDAHVEGRLVILE